MARIFGRVTYGRDTVEFARLVTFSDGVFAIAMTLLVVSIGVPTLSDAGSAGELADALNDLTPQFVSFFVSFAVIGGYWIAHHRFFSRLDSVDRRLVSLNLLYLCFIAFLPFPTALLGEYFENPLAVTLYAVAVAVVSGMEVVLFRHSEKNGLAQRRMPEDVYRFAIVMSLSPVFAFLLSIPIAFVLDTTIAALFWLSMVPFQIVTRRRRPPLADEYVS